MCVRYELVITCSQKERYPREEIDEQIYEKLKNARNILYNALMFEEKFEILIGNYLELEKEVLSQALDYSVRNDIDYNYFYFARLKFNTKLINLLTIARLYLDSCVTHHLKYCVDDQNEIEKKYNKFKSHEYDSHFSYRFMEELRNRTQHYELPIDKTQYGGENTETEGKIIQEYRATHFITKEKIKSDKKFKKKIIDEIEEKGLKNIDLTIFTKEYIQSLSRIHNKLRNEVTDKINSCRALLEDIHAKYPCGEKKGRSMIFAYKIKGRLDILEDFPLLLNFDDIRLKLVRKNNLLENLGIRYVTNKPKVK